MRECTRASQVADAKDTRPLFFPLPPKKESWGWRHQTTSIRASQSTLYLTWTGLVPTKRCFWCKLPFTGTAVYSYGIVWHCWCVTTLYSKVLHFVYEIIISFRFIFPASSSTTKGASNSTCSVQHTPLVDGTVSTKYTPSIIPPSLEKKEQLKPENEESKGVVKPGSYDVMWH